MSGNKFPAMICGMFQIKDSDVVDAVMDHALSCGYRSFDTAAVYRNEAYIGNALPALLDKYNLSRHDIFITTKLGPKDLSSDLSVKALETSLHNLKLDYVDLYLIHWPGRQGLKQHDPMNKKYRCDAWLELEEVYKKSNKIKYLGVSNYTLRHLIEMESYSTKLPDVVQNEFHPDFQECDVLNFCQEHKINFQAYSPLGSSNLVNDERFAGFAQKYKKSTSQILLKWSLQRGCSVIPKSTAFHHIQENYNALDSFVLDDDDCNTITSLGKQVKYCWNPNNVF